MKSVFKFLLDEILKLNEYMDTLPGITQRQQRFFKESYNSILATSSEAKQLSPTQRKIIAEEVAAASARLRLKCENN